MLGYPRIFDFSSLAGGVTHFSRFAPDTANVGTLAVLLPKCRTLAQVPPGASTANTPVSVCRCCSLNALARSSDTFCTKKGSERAPCSAHIAGHTARQVQQGASHQSVVCKHVLCMCMLCMYPPDTHKKEVGCVFSQVATMYSPPLPPRLLFFSGPITSLPPQQLGWPLPTGLLLGFDLPLRTTTSYFFRLARRRAGALPPAGKRAAA